MSTRAKVTKAERDEAIAQLRECLKPGDTVYTVLKHRSRSGMQREIAVLLVADATDGSGPYARNASYRVATALGWRCSDRDAVVVGGCGMDMGFHVVYTLGRVLFPEGGSLEHSPRRAQEERAGETRERDGGYLLKHCWL